MSTPTLILAPGCDDEHDPNALSCEDARARITAHVPVLEDREQVPLRTALGRVLGRDIVSRVNVPAHPNSAMDGYAIQGDDIPREGIARLTLLGAAFAGRPWIGRVAAGQAVRIMTGGVIPEGADTVIAQEKVEVDGNTLRFDGQHTRGQHVRRAGEDITAGSRVLAAGRVLEPSDLGLLASLGETEVTVIRRPRVAFFSTGDELRSLGEPLGPGEVYDSNRHTLQAMLARLGIEGLDLGVVRDDPQALQAAFTRASRLADVVLSSGGVSVGDADYTRAILTQLGEVAFWKIAMKPGRPLAFGRLGDALFFGLPGNPVSVMVTFYQFVQPALQRMMGMAPRPPLRLRARVVADLPKRPGRLEYQRGVFTQTPSGEFEVRATGGQSSGILSSMSQANCFIVLPLDSGRVAAGALVDIEAFAGLV